MKYRDISHRWYLLCALFLREESTFATLSGLFVRINTEFSEYGPPARIASFVPEYRVVRANDLQFYLVIKEMRVVQSFRKITTGMH